MQNPIASHDITFIKDYFLSYANTTMLRYGKCDLDGLYSIKAPLFLESFFHIMGGRESFDLESQACLCAIEHLPHFFIDKTPFTIFKSGQHFFLYQHGASIRAIVLSQESYQNYQNDFLTLLHRLCLT